MWRHAVLTTLTSAVIGGCAAHTPVDTSKLSRRIEELAQREAQSQRQIEELNNRLFLLEDKVDTGRVAQERSGAPLQLPVIRLKPDPVEPDGRGEGEIAREEDEPEEETGAADGADEPEEGRGGGRSVVENRRVVYRGEATRSGPRPVLRLHGAASGAPAPGGEKEVLLAGPDPARVTEKLPVIPLPPRRESIRSAQLEPMRQYTEAMGKYRSGQQAAAAEVFRGFFQRYRQHAYADNALYWMAECSYDLKKYRLALKLFRQVIEEYPTGNKAPDALLKVAYCLLRLKEEQGARNVLSQVMTSYPRSNVAKLAAQALAQLGSKKKAEGET